MPPPPLGTVACSLAAAAADCIRIAQREREKDGGRESCIKLLGSVYVFTIACVYESVCVCTHVCICLYVCMCVRTRVEKS